MTLNWPFWLVLIIPIAAGFWLARLPSRSLTLLRMATVLLLLLGLCGLSVQLPSRSGCVIVVADRSLSMPHGSQTQQREVIDLLARAMGPDDELGVVAFGQRVTVEQPPQHMRFGGFVNEVGNEGSNLGEAVDRAVSLIPRDRPGRLLVLSDGQATGSDVTAAAARAARSGIAIDYRAMQRSGAGDLAIERIDAPPSVAAGEAFMISAWVNSPQSQEVAYELAWGEHLLATGQRAVPEGRSRMIFRDKAGDGGSRSYTLRIRSLSGEKNDPVIENNSARFLIGIRGARPLLCVSPAASSFPRLLEAGGLKIDHRSPEECRWSLAELGGYSAVLIEDTPAGKIGTSGMETLSAWVTETGGGLLTTGGHNAYGTGGYFKSPLEPILPISMELRREHRKLSMAIVVALDRSGSMAMTVPGGRMKMDLANVATSEVLNQLSATDQFGCLAVDSVAHEIVPLSDLSNKAEMEAKVLKIDSMGGGIFVYEALEKAAAMISKATAGTKHIILFSDAADSEEPGNYADLLEKCRKAGITVSVIGLGTEQDSDADLLKDIALRGGGQCSFTEDAHELPRLFAQDTFLVSRSTFVDEPTSVRTTAGMTMLTPQAWGEFPQVGGYNLCYLRPGANLAAVTVDEYQAPLVTSWQAGAGRVLSYTGEADGKYTGPIANWPQTGEFFSSLARWVSAQDQNLGPDMLLTQELRDGNVHIKLHLDSERETTPFRSLPQLTLLRGEEGEKPDVQRLPLHWTTADVLSAEVPLSGNETLLTSVDVPGVGRTTLPPIRLPFSAEFAPRSPGEGLQTLQRMARATGGMERVNLGSLWSDLPRMPRMVSLAPWLLLTAMFLLLIDVLHRRTGLLSFRRQRAGRPVLEQSAAQRPPTVAPSKTKAAPLPPAGDSEKTKDAPTPASEPKSAPAAESPENVLDALSQARNRAARRTRR